mgnify:CR=1 FL=1
MITIDGVQYRNLEEQVKKNKDDIQYILEEEGVLNEFGIKIVGEITSASDLPDPTTYEGEFGDAYAVGTTTPYELYIYTRANGSHPTNYWFNIGEFPLAGPRGPQGPQGNPGADGSPALIFNSNRTTSTEPILGTSFSASSASYFNRTPISGDYFLQLVIGSEGTSVEGRSWITNNIITSISGGVYNYQIRSVMETTGATGAPGNPGTNGAPGPQGPQGPIGPQGNPGQSFVIAGTVANSNQLPDPSTVADNIAYLVGTQAPYDLYVQLQDSSEWFNAGIVEGVQGPQGPQGPMPPLVSTRGNSTSDAMSQQGIENIFYGSQVTLGVNSTASGENAIALGYGATASGTFSTALGRGATVNDDYSIALGQGVTANGSSATALGRGATANFQNTIAIGYGAKTNKEEAIAIGHSAYANFPNTIAIGYGAKANGTESTAIGVNCTVDANNSILIGAGANCDTDNTFQVGNYPLLDLTTGLIPSERIQGGGGVPAGGTTGQYLIKKSDTDYDTEWSNPAPLYRHTIRMQISNPPSPGSNRVIAYFSLISHDAAQITSYSELEDALGLEYPSYTTAEIAVNGRLDTYVNGATPSFKFTGIVFNLRLVHNRTSTSYTVTYVDLEQSDGEQTATFTPGTTDVSFSVSDEVNIIP